MNFFKSLGVHVFAIILSVVVLLTLVSWVLNYYTRHGDYLSVPDLRGLEAEDAIRVLEEKKLKFIISDSLYFEDKPRLSILEQNPAPESKVKEGRVIYLTINSNAAPLVVMPDIIDVSMRQAEAMLGSVGLKVGNLIYKPDIAKDVVLDVQYNGQSLQKGKKIGKGTAVDLVLGNGLGGESTTLPDLKGLTLEEANNLLQSSSLTLGSVVYMGQVTDSTQVKVVRQNPPYSEGASVSAGQPVDLFLRQE